MYIYIHIHTIYSHENNPMSLSSSLLKWLCGDMLAMAGQWRSSRISVRTNRVLSKH